MQKGRRDTQKVAGNTGSESVRNACGTDVLKTIGKTAVTAEPHKAEPRHAKKKRNKTWWGYPSRHTRSTKSSTNPMQGPAVRCVQEKCAQDLSKVGQRW